MYNKNGDHRQGENTNTQKALKGRGSWSVSVQDAKDSLGEINRANAQGGLLCLLHLPFSGFIELFGEFSEFLGRLQVIEQSDVAGQVLGHFVLQFLNFSEVLYAFLQPGQ